MTLSQDQLRVIYDAQLKKMLAYIAVAITSFLAELTTFLSALGQNHMTSTALFVGPFLLLGLAFAGLLWCFQCYLGIAIVAKFQEIVILERKLGTKQFFDDIKEDRFFLSRVLDELTTKALRTKVEIDDHAYARRLNPFLNSITILSLAVPTGLFIFVAVLLGVPMVIAVSIVAILVAVAVIVGDP